MALKVAINGTGRIGLIVTKIKDSLTFIPITFLVYFTGSLKFLVDWNLDKELCSVLSILYIDFPF